MIDTKTVKDRRALRFETFDEAVRDAEALAALRTAFDRLASQSPTQPNPLFGQMTHDQWIKLNLRHAELHLSFFHPR